jgi:RimJ/RimL family protein N-acetyltransferase
MIGDKKMWGRGIGREVMRLMVEHGFNRLNLHKFEFPCAAEHKAAVRMLLAVGFKFEGRQREAAFRWGKYEDDFRMGLLASEFGRAGRESPRARSPKRSRR